MLEVTYQYNDSIRKVTYETISEFINSQMACSLEVPSYYNVKKVVLDGKIIDNVEGLSQDELYNFFNK